MWIILLSQQEISIFAVPVALRKGIGACGSCFGFGHRAKDLGSTCLGQWHKNSQSMIGMTGLIEPDLSACGLSATIGSWAGRPGDRPQWEEGDALAWGFLNNNNSFRGPQVGLSEHSNS